MEKVQQEELQVATKWFNGKFLIGLKDSLKTFFYGLVIMLDIMLESLAMMAIGSLMLLFGF